MMQTTKSGVLCGLVTLSLWLTGCSGFFVPQNNSGGSGSTTVNSGDYIYAANANPSEASIAGFGVSSSGTLSALSGSPYTLNFLPTALAVTPSNAYLFVGGTTGLYAYSIGSNGALTLAGNSGASIPVASIAISPDGNYLFALQSNVIVGSNTPTAYSVTLDEYQIGTGGALTLVANPSYSTTSGTFTPQMVRVSPSGGYVALALGSAGDIVFTFASGTLSNTVQVIPEATISSDNALTFDSTSSYLYIARSGTSSGLAAYAISSTGVLSQVGSTLGAAGSQPSAVVLGPTGKFAYVTNRGDGTISAFSITAGSVPSPLVGSPYASGAQPTALGVDNSGKYLLAVSTGGSPDLDMYALGSTGGLATPTSATTQTDPALAIALALTH